MVVSRQLKEHFSNSSQHILAELERIDLLIQSQIARTRLLQKQDEQFRGLYISEEELDTLLRQPIGRPHWFQVESPVDQLESALEKLKCQIDQRKSECTRLGIELRLNFIEKIFNLSRFEIDSLLICLALEFDLRYERLYAYLQDDVTKKKPSIDLVLNLLQATAEGKLNGLQYFFENAALRKHDLIATSSDPAQPNPPLLGKNLKLDYRIAQYLLGSDDVDERISSKATKVKLQDGSDQRYLDSDLCIKLKSMLHSGWLSGDVIINLIGRYGIGKFKTAKMLCVEAGLNLISVDIGRLITEKDISWDMQLRLISREAMLQHAAVYWKGFDTLFEQQHEALLRLFIRHLGDAPGIKILASEKPWPTLRELCAVPYLQIELPLPELESRIRIWSASLGDDLGDGNELDIADLAGKFKFTGGQIQDAAATAKNLAGWQDTKTGQVKMEQLYEACRMHSNQTLSTLARKISPAYQWQDIVLPSDRTEQMREICNFVKYKDRVYQEWGFDAKLALGKGLSVLFAGPSGTGKTMAADIIAGALDLDLYKIDLSTVISKYIGETEKNLSRIFNEAETSNAILFFDEADALFGKRSEVKDSHDRYANIEIGYLLQRMEEYEGVVILATNFRKNMDEAFVRRLHFTVEFPFPNEKDRRRIWEGVWPDETPRDSELDFEFIARRFELSGGNIRNIALGAAFLAADNGNLVNMNHLIRATQREYRKMGKVVNDGDFSGYADSSLLQVTDFKKGGG